MIDKDVPAFSLWEERAYAVVSGRDALVKTERSGLSHVEAMLLAENLQREGKVVSVTHVVGERSYEVDQYPVRGGR